MREHKTHVFEDPKNLGDLRKIVQATRDLDDNTRITVTKTEGDQRDPGYCTVTVTEV